MVKVWLMGGSASGFPLLRVKRIRPQEAFDLVDHCYFSCGATERNHRGECFHAQFRQFFHRNSEVRIVCIHIQTNLYLGYQQSHVLVGFGVHIQSN